MKKQLDERVLQERRQINSSAFSIALIGLWIILDVRLFIQKQSITEFLDIFILTMVLSVYVLVRIILKGHYTVETQGKSLNKIFYLGGLVGAVVFLTTQLWINDFNIDGTKDILFYIGSFLIFVLTWILGQKLFVLLSTKQIEHIE